MGRKLRERLCLHQVRDDCHRWPRVRACLPVTTSQALATVDSVTQATWVGAFGTWAVGVAAVWIAIMQYQHAKFRPVVWAFRDNVGRVMVRVINKGAGAGFVTDVNLLSPAHLVKGNPDGILHYKWELEGAASDDRPLPFSLMGGSSAQLFLLADQGASFDGLRVRVDYGTGNDSGCQGISQVEGRIFGTTFIAGVIPNPGGVSAPRTLARNRGLRRGGRLGGVRGR